MLVAKHIMETPPVTGKKSLVNSISKSSLTPCRRLGLSRPPSSLKKSHVLRTLTSPAEQSDGLCSEKTPVSLCENRLSVSLKEDNAIQTNKVLRARRCLTVSPDVNSTANDEVSYVLKQTHKDNITSGNVSRKRKCINENSDVLSDSVASKSRSSSASDIKITSEAIEKIAQSIRKKKKTLEELKVQDIYAKKHNLEELREETAKWRTAGQEALRYSVSLSKQAGYSVTLQGLMSQHGFLPHLMGYNSEDDEFV